MSAQTAKPLWSVVDRSLDVDYRRFNLVDDEADAEEAILAHLEPPDWVVAGDGWVALLSGGSGHSPEILMEAWESEPPADGEPWASELTTDARFPSGELRIWGTATGSSMGPNMVLPPSEELRYKVRVQVRGGDGSRSVEDLVIDAVERAEDGPFHFEQWRFQFWPAASE